MPNFYETVLDVLKQDNRFVANDGTFMRNAVYEASIQMDSNLIHLLLANPETKKEFFRDVDGVLVFDKVGFGWVINNRQFLPDSYTRFKNKIGLADENGELISASGKVELVFPYKDCVLEGGQTKEEQKRKEIFYNTALAPNEVDRLMFPKVFCNAKKIDANGVRKAESFDKSNILIKGNNLLTISSLNKIYEGKVKLIYIDVPYNTGNDSFKYNDKFNHSSWLLFIKNRLEIAHKLLDVSGTIAVSVDNYELAYMLVLLDEIFGKENRKNIITVRRASVSGAKVINPGVVNIVEYVVIYSKDTNLWKPNRIYQARGYDDRYNTYVKNINDNYDKWEFISVLDAFSEEMGIPKSKLKKQLGNGYDVELENFVITHSDSIVQFASLNDNQISAESLELKKKSIAAPNTILYQKREGFRDYYLLNGHVILFAKDRIMNIDGHKTFSTPVSDIWDDVLPNDIHNEGGVELKKGKKPEKLISRIVELCTNEGDVVLDFFAGSGTTGAVCLKMKRKFILCEQMDYIENITCQRLINVVQGDTRGVSAQYEWQGGGSFVYCELAKLNQNYVDELQSATTEEEIKDIYSHVMKSGFISSKVDPKEINENIDDFYALSLDDQKRFLMELLDKNLLYVNYCDIDDQEFGISEADKAFTKSFYGD